MVDIYKFLKPNTRIEIGYTDKFNNRKCLSSEIIKICTDEILIDFPEKDILTSSHPDKISEFSLVISTENGVVSANTNFINDDEKGWYISFPYNTKFCQRREDLRTPVHIDFELTTNEKTYQFTTKNLSGRGLAFISNEEILFDKAMVNLKLDEQSILNLNGQKIYTIELENFETPTFLTGLYFPEINSDDLKKIIRKCMTLQTSAKQNENLFDSI